MTLNVLVALNDNVLNYKNLKDSCFVAPGGGTPIIRMIGMVVIFLGVEIGDLVFLSAVQAKYIKKYITAIC